jgi:hypothetical protein
MSEEIISEIEDDLQKERMQKIWTVYGKYILSIIFCVVILIGGWQLFSFWNEKKLNDASNSYLEILRKSNTDINLALNEIDKISYLPKGYNYLIKFKKASLLNQSGDHSKAQSTWKELYNDINLDQDYRDIALMLSLMHNADQPEQLEKLDSIINSGSQFSIISNEIKASIHLRNGEINQSKEIYEDILTAKNINQRTQERIKNILKSFGEN